jgi:hypothetical protein
MVERLGSLAASRLWWNRAAAGAAVLVTILAALFAYRSLQPRRVAVRMTAGQALGRRHELAIALQNQAARRGLDIKLVPSAGSEEALDQVAHGEIELALCQGGLASPAPGLREVAALVPEPLHLFVRPQLAAGGLEGLRGKRLNLGASGSGTRKLARQTLAFAGLVAGRDYTEEDRDYEELRELDSAQLPDGLFAVSALPWHLGRDFVQARGYQLFELPFGDAMSLEDRGLRDTVIPAFSYRVVPAAPGHNLHTVGAPLLVVASERVPQNTVLRLLEVIYESDFARHADLPPLAQADLEHRAEYPLHPGTLRYLHRGEPLVTGEIIESAENARSFLVSAAIAAFLIWKWRSRRRQIGFDTYFDGVTQIELEAAELDRSNRLDIDDLRRLRGRLTQLKTEALERHARGELKGEELMASFLAHASDVRSFLESLFAHESRQANLPQAADGTATPAPH